MEKVFTIKDKTGREIHLSKERFKHISHHPFMNEQIEAIKDNYKIQQQSDIFRMMKMSDIFIKNLRREMLLRDICWYQLNI